MITGADLIAGYGAVLATVLGFIQFSEWRSKKRALSIKYVQYFSGDDSDILVTVSNRSDRPAHIDFFGICAFERERFKFWIWDDVSAKSLSKMKQRDPLIGKGVIDGETINPGQMIYGVANIAEFKDLSRPPWGDQKKPQIRYGVILEHSLSDEPLRQLFKLDLD